MTSDEIGRASQRAMAAVPKTAEQQCLEGSTPSPSACFYRIGGRLTVGCLALNEAMKVRFLLPELIRASEKRGLAPATPWETWKTVGAVAGACPLFSQAYGSVGNWQTIET